MFQLNNNTPFSASLALFPNKDGLDTLYVMVSARLNIGSKWTLAEEQVPPRTEDIYWGDDPTTSSIRFGNELHVGKPATDIVMVGHACAPEGKRVTQQDVQLQVGYVNKTVRVFGDRQWHNGAISDPVPFTTMPLIYERAFGGQHVHDGKIISAELRNLVGCSYLGKQNINVLDDTPVPNLEDPRKLLKSAGDIVTPAGFGFISPNWQPRISYVGTYDDNWRNERAPYLPKDFDQRFFNMAHPDLVYPGYIQGGEPVRINGVHPQGSLQFKLPAIALSARILFDKREERGEFRLETVLIEADELCLSLSWKAEVACDKSALKIKEIFINLVQQRRRAA